ncbi:MULTISPECIES: phosphate acyltransferase PlsX [Cetobacterium]|jgi:glycerol-3-phosphate acyltransferase PlsX|uniref:Phosphate acyltransferase n=1 Tax=Candidatus Cetobacterium colombiensis TaxID=3073100 RepID=A0ABU4WAV9_9FUSO|nr:phosphate acyltransferase PlsX [Candidatus Cetobacterium colombiensis]MDX8336671.1 phosphate acyltransferase PlsX [Candidatus Cetobacterium colombiensis]
MRIALDAMGGDFAPIETVKGAIKALEEIKDLTVVLVGQKEKIELELEKYSYDKNRIEIFDAREVIKMTDDPMVAVRSKKDSSMNRMLELVKSGDVAASVSAGNTGALISASQLKLRRIKGVLRPAITTIFPSKKRDIVLMDVGANADCRPEFINQFATMGSLYYEEMFGVENPRVGLLNIGTEEGKGNEITREAFNLLKENDRINFIGNIESREMMDGDVDVIVADGFTGNMVLKTAEGTAKFIFSILKEEIGNSILGKAGALLLRPILKKLKRKLDSSEYGGALFLGINGISIKAHGNSSARGIKNALKVANKFAEDKFIDRLTEVMKQNQGGNDEA